MSKGGPLKLSMGHLFVRIILFSRFKQLRSDGFFYWQNPFALCLYCLLFSSGLLLVNHYLTNAPSWLWIISIFVWTFSGFVTLFCVGILFYGLLYWLGRTR